MARPLDLPERGQRGWAAGTGRSLAKPFLQSLVIVPWPPPHLAPADCFRKRGIAPRGRVKATPDFHSHDVLSRRFPERLSEEQ
jgi:hypothetical protein